MARPRTTPATPGTFTASVDEIDAVMDRIRERVVELEAAGADVYELAPFVDMYLLADRLRDEARARG